jgi:hypothetical protein
VREQRVRRAVAFFVRAVVAAATTWVRDASESVRDQNVVEKRTATTDTA